MDGKHSIIGVPDFLIHCAILLIRCLISSVAWFQWWEWFFSGLHPKKMIQRVYSHFRRASDGCDGATGFGFNGCLNVTSLFVIFQAIGLRGKRLVDLGAGEGRVLASAMKYGAHWVVGYELPVNSAHKYVYHAVLRRIYEGIVHFDIVSPCAQWLAQDIDEVFVNRVSFILDLSWPYDFPFISFLNFLMQRKLSIHFGMVCQLRPRFTFSNIQPAAHLSAHSWFFKTTNGLRQGKVILWIKFSLCFFFLVTVTIASVSFSMVLLQWFQLSTNILRIGSGLYSGS